MGLKVLPLCKGHSGLRAPVPQQRPQTPRPTQSRPRPHPCSPLRRPPPPAVGLLRDLTRCDICSENWRSRLLARLVRPLTSRTCHALIVSRKISIFSVSSQVAEEQNRPPPPVFLGFRGYGLGSKVWGWVSGFEGLEVRFRVYELGLRV